ncbi:MAG TPA: hypothetical protein VGO47_11750 [Chlamydiales bacterium]|nr:hypothetical protein [Chlamydiales bacterium]
MLQRFTLGYVTLSRTLQTLSTTTLARFFRSHPALYAVAFLDAALMLPGSIPPDALPRLRTLVLDMWDTPVVDVLPVDVARHLVNFHGKLDIQGDGGRSSHLLSQMSSLETCNNKYIMALLGGLWRV